MRTIILGGLPCPIKATAATIAANADRLNAKLMDADEEAELEAKEKKLDVDAAEALRAQIRKKVYRLFLANAENSLMVIADMVNAAVDSERILYGRDIREQSPHYPMTPQKLACIASLKELNNPDTARQIAEEIAEATGSKNLNAGELVKMAQMIL